MTLQKYFASPGALSKSDLARRCGVTPSAIGHYTTGRRRPSLKVAQKIEEETMGAVQICDLTPQGIPDGYKLVPLSEEDEDIAKCRDTFARLVKSREAAA